jgi:hypothetical protein
VLSNFPETLEPEVYAKLLPKIELVLLFSIFNVLATLLKSKYDIHKEMAKSLHLKNLRS